MLFRIAFISLVLNILSYNEVDAATPQIVQRIITETQPVKGIAYLNCTVAMMGNKEASVKWMRMSDRSELTNGLKVTTPNILGRYEVRSSQGRSRAIPDMSKDSLVLETYTLIIRNLMESDAGQYACKIDQSGLRPDQKPQAIGILVVQSPANIQPGALLAPKVINEFGTLTLECNAKGSEPITISWTRANGKPLNLPPLPGQKQKPQRSYGKKLIIQNMTREDRGIYRCHAQNNVDNADEYDVVVEVNFPPKAEQARLDGFYAQSPDGVYSVALECIVSGYPPPDVRFYKGPYDPPRYNPPEIKDAFDIQVEKMYSYGAVGLSYDQYLYELRILNVKTNSFGNYTCLAVNRFGTHQTTLTLANQPVCQGALCFLSQMSAIPTSAHAFKPSTCLLSIAVVFSMLQLIGLVLH